ncbi:hypothetical protein BJV78DRAFT_314631 [Lactifluus subvellereus]|nr:hypothetical protein BJV78DRAFT_314631 [Lactifluus subvellereus]
MSSDADELGGFDPSTPYQPSKKRKTPASRPVAGPSTARASRPATRGQRKPSRESPMIVEDDDEDIPEVVQPEPRAKGKTKVAASPATNGKPPPKAKGKGKADSTVNGHKDGSELVVIEELDDDEPVVTKPLSPAKKGKPRTDKSVSLDLEEGEIVKSELERMREERDLYKAKSEELSETLLQLIQTRNTEPEEQLESMKAQYGAASREELIKELTAQIARLTPMLKDGRTSTSTLHFLTREAADEENRVLEERFRKVQEDLRQKDAVIKDKDARIAALNEQLETTQADLKAEIAHSQTLQNRSTKGQREPPASALRGRATQETLINDPKHGVTIRLYEDLTNLIVLSAKMQESPYAHLNDLDEIIYKCVFSHMNTASLSFLLTSMHQPKPSPDPARSPPSAKTKDDLQHMVRYTPLELDKESQEYIQKLDFLADTFTFAYDQMEFFLKTLNDHFSSLAEEQDDSAMTEG